ncbi:hypothetical protein [Pseudomonas aeruginosa]|uniref:hypothetical protein n=2 Tax=Pseudomonas aeruginosa TaxID=287 RepID=UPI00163D3523|nr:hypothetical protein [Pseudomonas aeruginosa]HCL4106760.1 hypothetical protein [Pseudomonas aeruginosa]
MTNELTDVRCPCGTEFPAESYDAGFIAGSGMCQNCDAALPPKDICTCPSGDGSLRHPCPAHPAVEQAGGDERDLQGTQGERDGWGPFPIVQVPWNVFDRAVMWVEDRRRYGDDGTIVDDWKALKTIQRAALAQPSPKSGYYSDQEWINAGCPPEQPSPVPADEKPGDSILCYGCFAKGVGPEHFDEAGKCLVRQQTEPLGAEFAQVLSDNLPELLSTAQAEQAEAERPEVVAWRYGFSGGIVSDKACLDEWKSGGEYQSLMTVAQHERIVGALRAKTDQLREALEWRKENQAGQRELLRSVTAERDAALARVAKLEHSQSFQRDIDYSVLSEYADKHRLHFNNLCAVVRSALIALPAQAQHSVPEGWMLVECGIWTQEQVDEMQRTVARFRSSEFVDDRALAMAVAYAGQCKAPEISLAELLAAAPGNEGV